MPVHLYLNGDVGNSWSKGEEMPQPVKTAIGIDVGHADVAQGE